MDKIIVRPADEGDAEDICRLIHELAAYEEMADKCTLDPQKLIMLMSETNGLGGLVAQAEGKTVGMLVYSVYKLATFSGKRVFYIEDIFVEEAFRGRGAGSALFDKARDTAKELGCIKLEWKCLDWNRSARDFYERKGGVSDPGWLTYTIGID